MKNFIKALLLLFFAVSVTTSSWAVVMVSWGGAYTESQKLGYGDPAAKKLGIPIVWVDYSGGLSEISDTSPWKVLFSPINSATNELTGSSYNLSGLDSC